MLTQDDVSNIVSGCICAAAVALYHIYLVIRAMRQPETTVAGLTRWSRKVWVHHLMSLNKLDVYPVQALRNLTMSASILATVAITLALAILTFLDKSPPLLVLSDHALRLRTVCISLLAMCFLCAFFCFVQAMRYYNHVIFVLNGSLWTPQLIKQADPSRDRVAKVVTPRTVANLLNRGGLFFTLGMRAYYFSFPVALWLVGSYYLYAGTIALLIILYYCDLDVAAYSDDGEEAGGTEGRTYHAFQGASMESV